MAPKKHDGIDRISYGVRIDPSLLLRLKHFAVDEKSSVSHLIETAISQFLDRKDKKKK